MLIGFVGVTVITKFQLNGFGVISQMAGSNQNAFIIRVEIKATVAENVPS